MTDLGIQHEWITTDRGEAAGMGNQHGVPGEGGQTSPDLPFTPTEVVDHTGRQPETQQQIGGVDMDALGTYLEPGRPTGPFVPGANDCNTWTDNAINESTPHDVHGLGGAALEDQLGGMPNPNVLRDVVRDADGRWHPPGPNISLPPSPPNKEVEDGPIYEGPPVLSPPNVGGNPVPEIVDAPILL